MIMMLMLLIPTFAPHLPAHELRALVPLGLTQRRFTCTYLEKHKYKQENRSNFEKPSLNRDQEVSGIRKSG